MFKPFWILLKPLFVKDTPNTYFPLLQEQVNKAFKYWKSGLERINELWPFLQHLIWGEEAVCTYKRRESQVQLSLGIDQCSCVALGVGEAWASCCCDFVLNKAPMAFKEEPKGFRCWLIGKLGCPPSVIYFVFILNIAEVPFPLSVLNTGCTGIELCH